MRCLLVICIASSVFSCIPRKKIIYAQLSNEEDIVSKTDSFEVEVDYFMSEYTFKPGDILKITMFSLSHDDYNFLDANEDKLRPNDPRLSGYMIDDSGAVNLPIVGAVPVSDMTTSQAEKAIEEELKKYLPAPSVVIKHLNYSFSILGEVKKPGQFNSYEKNINIFEALSQAGDLTEFADRSKVKIIRFTDGKAQIYYVNLLDDEIINSPVFQVMPNDAIIVAPMKVKNFKKYVLANYGLIISTLTALTLIFWRLGSTN